MLPKFRKFSIKKYFRFRRITMIVLLVTGIVLIATGLSAWLWVPRTITYEIQVTGGNAALNRHEVAEYLKRHSSELNLEIEIVPTEGTPEAVRKVQAKELDLALVNGLLRFPKADNVRQVATLTIEPAHLLVKGEEFAKKVADDYANLEGKKVDVGPAGYETAMLAGAVLKFLRLKIAQPGEKDGVQLTDFGIDKLFAQLDRLEKAPQDKKAELKATLPDAVFHGSTLPSTLAQQLIRVGDYKLVELPFAKSFAQISVEEEDLDRDHIDQIHAEPAVIPAYSYGGNPPEPKSDCRTLGAPLIVIAHKDVPDEVIARLLPRFYSGPIGRLYNPPDLDDVTPTYPFHSASIAYRDSDQPIVRADVVDLVQQIFSVIAPIAGGFLALYGYYRWRQMLRFLDYFRRLQRLDLIAKGLLKEDNLPPDGPERVRYLEGELEVLQRKAIDDFCQNYFYGEGVLENFLSLLSETRDYLRRSYLKSLPENSKQTTDH